jgi:hypothetical protein
VKFRLNPIELVWVILKHAVAKLQPRAIPELKSVLLRVWYQMAQWGVDSLCGSFEVRLEMRRELKAYSQ